MLYLLITETKFEYNKIINIITKQLDIENINLTKTVFEKLSQFLNKNDDVIKQYLISNEDDLSNEIKINFFYILIKYILKDDIYIYYFPLLLQTKKTIQSIVKEKQIIFSYNI